MMKYPNDWTETTLGKSVQIARGASPRPIEAFLTTSIDGVNWIKIGDAPKEGKYITHTEEKITVSGARKSVTVRAGDFILSNSMSFGRPYILAVDGCIHDGWLRLFDYNEQIDKEFLYYILSFRLIQEQFATFAAGSGVQNLNKEVVKKVVVHFPSKPEQKAIAETLTIFDTHIANLTELIEKKKAIREGALEDLVSGKTRLSGFTGKWERVNFESVIIPKARIGWQGLKSEEYLRKGFCYLIGGTDFLNGTVSLENIWYVSEERYAMDANIQVEENDVLVTKDGTIGKIAVVPHLGKPATLNSGVFVFRTKNGLTRQFLYRVLISSIFREFIDKLAAGSTIKHLYQKDLKNFSFSMPTDEAEQEAIASVLNTMDYEILSLEEERDKMIKIREGAMDDLLTGKVRLTD